MKSENAPYVLMVDDHANTRRVFRALRKGAGHTVQEASNGREALDLLLLPTQPAPALTLLDIEMPLMTGLELATVLESYHRLDGTVSDG